MVVMMMAVRLLRIDSAGFQNRVDCIMNGLGKIARVARIAHPINRVVDGVFDLSAQIGQIGCR